MSAADPLIGTWGRIMTEANGIMVSLAIPRTLSQQDIIYIYIYICIDEDIMRLNFRII